MAELLRKIKKKYQRDIAFAQDLVVEIIYSFFPMAVLHGGTVIWRCFKSNRFSEDLDFYLEKKDEEKIKKFFENLERYGFEIKKLRIKERSVFSKLSHGGVEIRVEIVFKKAEATLIDYECIDGRIIPVRGLRIENLIQEKVDAFIKRKKIRDLYDVYYLLKFVEKSERIKKKILNLLKSFEKPEDEKDLEKVIIFGYAPKSEEILEYLKMWLK
jgi:predicted nucleotidyltransferase component of viral defense system